MSLTVSEKHGRFYSAYIWQIIYCAYIYFCVITIDFIHIIVGIAQLVETWFEVASSILNWGSGRIFFCSVNFLYWLLFDVRYTPMLQQWHIKDPGHSAKSAGGRFRQNLHTPLAQQKLEWADDTVQA